MGKASTKQEARRLVQTKLDEMPLSEYAEISGHVATNLQQALQQLRETCSIRRLLGYHAQPVWREVDVTQLEINEVQLEYVDFDAQAVFRATLYDAILVPLYGFNENGYRLGHGSGWYDAFLKTQPQAVRVGVGLEMNRIDFTVDPHDIPMDIIVTDARSTLTMHRAATGY